MIAVLLATAMSGTVAAAQPEPTLRLVGIYGGSVALDFAASEYAIAHGAREANWFMRDRRVRVGTVVASTALLVWSTQELQRMGHPKKARCVKRTAIVVRVLLAIRAFKIGLDRKGRGQ